MLGVKQTDQEKEVAGGDGIKKNNTVKKAEKKKEKQRTKDRENAKEVSLMDRQKELFKNAKTLYNSIKGESPKALSALEDARIQYGKLRALYETAIQENDERERNLAEKVDELTKRYETAEHMLTKAQAARDKLVSTGELVYLKWTNLREKPVVLPEQKREGHLSKKERIYLRDQATLYTELSQEADKFETEDKELARLIDKYTKNKDKASASKILMKNSYDRHKEEVRRLRKEYNTFKGTRNAEFRTPSDMVNGVSESGEEEEANMVEDIQPQQTIESEKRVWSIADIQEKLENGEYEALLKEYNKPHERFFIDRLIAMYSDRERYQQDIDMYTHEYISYLLDEHNKVIVDMFELLPGPFAPDPFVLIAYLEKLQPPIFIANVQNKLIPLLQLVSLSDEPLLLRRINAFLHDEPAFFHENKPVDVNEKEETMEEIRARVLFAPYKIDKDVSWQSKGCNYTATDDSKNALLIRVLPYQEGVSEKHEAIHEMLANHIGFARTLQIFHLNQFPLNVLHHPCANIRNVDLATRCTVYVTEYPDQSLSFLKRQEHLTRQDRLCIITELLYALYKAKKQYGIQHNDITRRNIRFNYLKEKRTLAGMECPNFELKLINLEYATIEPDMSKEERALLAHNDFLSFIEIATYKKISTSFSESLTTLLANNANAVPFDDLFKILKVETDDV